MLQALLHLVDRRALRNESDRVSSSIITLQRQVAVIVNSHLDTVIVDAMRQYASAASRLGLPARTEVRRFHLQPFFRFHLQPTVGGRM